MVNSGGLWGSVAGNVSVVKGGKFYLRGSVYGNISAESGGRAHLLGNVSGDLIVMEDAKVILGGAVGGDAINEGGRLYIEHTAKVMGKVKGRKGKRFEFSDPTAANGDRLFVFHRDVDTVRQRLKQGG